jgi:DNA methyltransferase 1-associated protein 1
MPTEDVCYKYDHLQNSVVALLELKKVAEKLDINTKTTIKGRVSDHLHNRQSLIPLSFFQKHSLSVSSASANRSANERRRKLA